MRPFTASVPPFVRAAGIEVAPELGAPLLQGPAQAGDLSDRARGERREDLPGDRPAGGVAVLVGGGADLLGADPGEFDLEVPLVSGPRRVQSCSLPVGEVLSWPARRMFRIRYSGSPRRPRCPRVSC